MLTKINDKDYRIEPNGAFFLIEDDNEKERSPYIWSHKREKVGENLYSTIEGHSAARILAENFIPNPYNLPQVEVIDGDYSNLSIDNLRWVSYNYSVRKGIEHSTKFSICPVCGYNYRLRSGSCPKCREKEEAIQKKIDKKERIKNDIGNFDYSFLDSRRQEILEKRLEGRTLESIGKDYGLTRERIRQIVDTSKKIAVRRRIFQLENELHSLRESEWF